MAKRRKYRHRSHFKIKLKKETVKTIGAIWMWLIAATIFLSFFGSGSPIHMIHDELFGQIGWATYVIPGILVVMSLLFFKLKHPIAQPNVSLGLILMLCSLIPLTQTGMVGESLMTWLTTSVSAEFTYILFISLFIVGLVLTFNASLDKAVSLFLVACEKLWKWIKGLFSAKKGKQIGKPLFPNEKAPLVIKGMDTEKPLGKPDMVVPQTGGKENKPTIAAGKQGVAANAVQTADSKIVSPVSSQALKIWEYPPDTLLSDGPNEKADRGDVNQNAQTIYDTLADFGIRTHVEEVNRGPAVTQYALRIASGVKLSKITSLSSDLALALAAPTGQVRIEAPIPGRNLVGIEIPNRGLEFVTLKRMIRSPDMKPGKKKLTVALGLDVSGNPVVTDIAKMPHCLVAGTTGSGKSVLINAFICSILFRTTPQEVRLILVDPKRVELTGYNGIPHLLAPVIVEPDQILSSLHWAIKEMEDRYKKFAEVGVRNIDGFNEQSGFQAMPYIVIIIDELADLMAYAPADVEDSICRLAQMARATGIHLVLATQRPSVDVITGLLKANIPTRIAFNVSSMIDSRVIIDMPGAEKLLGRGDMLFIPPEQSKPSRIQGTFVSEQEVNKVVAFLKTHNQPVQYTEEVITTPVPSGKKGTGFAGGEGGEGKDPLFEQALSVVCQMDKASSSLLQRKLKIGYARAARIIDQLEEAGVVGPGEGSKPRDVLMKNASEVMENQSQQEGNG